MQITILELFKSIVTINNEESLRPYVLKSMIENYNMDYGDPLLITGVYSILRKESKEIEFENIKLNYNGPLVFSYCNHSGEWFIKEFKSFKDVEEYILGGAGYFNMFTGSIIVFYDGDIKEFNVIRKLPNDEKVILNQGEDKGINDVVVEWIL